MTIVDIDRLLIAADPARRAGAVDPAEAERLYQRIVQEPPARVRGRRERGFASPRGTGSAGWRRPAIVLVAAAAAAAGIFTVQALVPSGDGPLVTPANHPAGVVTVQELARRTAAAAAAQPPIQPGQWVYWREYTYDWLQISDPGLTETWTTANGLHDALTFRGRLVQLNGPFNGQPGLFTQSHGTFVQAFTSFRLTKCGRLGCSGAGSGGYAFSRNWQGSCVNVPMAGHCVTTLFSRPMLGAGGDSPALSYAGLSKLPASPAALDRYLSHLRGAGTGSVPQREFYAIGSLLSSYLMPPKLTAELYRALGDVPGLTVDPHAVDVAGRPGVGFSFSLNPRGAAEEIVVNPHTYQLMGLTLFGRFHRLFTGTAFLQQVPVPRPGVIPRAK